MKVKKIYSFENNGRQIWRLLLSEDNYLIIETRDLQLKEVFFHALNVFSGKAIFKNYQPEEKYWIGIEQVYKNFIFFHKFSKPDMPGHREIIALEILTKNILWKNSEYTFEFIYNDKIYCYKQFFEGRKYFILDAKTGNVSEEMSADVAEINRLRNLSADENNFSDYRFPEKYDKNYIDEQKVINAVDNSIKSFDIAGEVEYNLFGNFLLFNFHRKIDNSFLENKFFVIDLNSGLVLFSTVINAKAKAFVPDSFFVYKELLFLLKEKNELHVFKLE